jgi:hypothetical protein
MSSDDFQIFYEPVAEPGLKKTALSEKEQKEAIKNSLKAVKWVAEETKTLLKDATHRPDEAEIEVGIKITAKGGVLVVQGEAEFHIKARLLWKNVNDDGSNQSSS